MSQHDSDLKPMSESDTRVSRRVFNALVRAAQSFRAMSGEGVTMTPSGVTIGGDRPSLAPPAFAVEFVKVTGYGTGLWNKPRSSFKARRLNASRGMIGPPVDVYARSYHPDTPSVACGIQDLALCTPGYTVDHEIAVVPMLYRGVTVLWAVDTFLLTCSGAART